MHLPLAFFTILAVVTANPTSDRIEMAAKRHPFEWFGLTLKAAERKAAEGETDFRIVKLEGKYLPVTKDYRPGRINAHVVGDKVVAVAIEGQSHSIVEGVINLQHLSYLGLPEEEAIKHAELNQLPFRIVTRDGKSKPVTQDYIKNRANAVVEKGVVVAVTTG